MLDPLHEMALFADSALQLLARRDEVAYQCNVAQEQLSKKESGRTSAEAGGGKFSLFSKPSESAKKEKVDKATAQVEEVSSLVILHSFFAWCSTPVG